MLGFCLFFWGVGVVGFLVLGLVCLLVFGFWGFFLSNLEHAPMLGPSRESVAPYNSHQVTLQISSTHLLLGRKAAQKETQEPEQPSFTPSQSLIPSISALFHLRSGPSDFGKIVQKVCGTCLKPFHAIFCSNCDEMGNENINID